MKIHFVKLLQNEKDVKKPGWTVLLYPTFIMALAITVVIIMVFPA